MNTLQYLEACKKRLGIESDYALAKALNVGHATISLYRSRGGQMDDKVAVKVAEVLGVHAGFVVLDMHRERAKTADEQSVWQEIYKGFLHLLPQAKFGVERRALPRLQQ